MKPPEDNDNDELDRQNSDDFYDPAAHAEELYEDLREVWLEADRQTCWHQLLHLRNTAATTETAEHDSVLMEVLTDILNPTKYLKQ